MRRSDAFCARSSVNLFSLRARADATGSLQVHEGRRAHIVHTGLVVGVVLVGFPERSNAERERAAEVERLAGMRSQAPAAGDIIHPASLLGMWQCERVVSAVEGNAEQASQVWQALGGDHADTFRQKKVEKFATRFIAAPESILSAYDFEGQSLNGVILADLRFRRDCATVAGLSGML